MTVHIVFSFVNKYFKVVSKSLFIPPFGKGQLLCMHALALVICTTRYTTRHFFNSKYADAKVMYKGGNELTFALNKILSDYELNVSVKIINEFPSVPYGNRREPIFGRYFVHWVSDMKNLKLNLEL